MKKFLASAVLALLVSLAFGQGLTVWTPFDGRALDYLEEDVAAFSAAFGVPAEVVRREIPSIKQQMLTTAAEGAAADVLAGIPHDQIIEMAEGAVLADLGAYATQAYLADLSEPARSAFTHGGALLGLPLSVEGPALLYNRALIPELPATYEAFLELAGDLTGDGRYGFLFEVDNFYFNYAWLNTFGGYVFGRERGSLQEDDVGLATAGAVRGAEELRSLRHERGLIPAGTRYEDAQALFTNGSAAAFYTGAWAVGPAREARIDVGVAPLPPLADGTPWSGFMSVDGVLVNEFSDSKAHAVNLAKWLTRPDAQLAYARRVGRVPASLGALDEASDDPILAGFGRALLTSEPIPNLRRMGRVWGAMARAISEVLADDEGDVTPALERAVREIRGE